MTISTTIATVICAVVALVSFKNYLDKRNNMALYFGITMLLWVVAGIFISLISPELSETLITNYSKLFATSGLLSLTFLIMFVASIANRENVSEYGLIILGFVFCALYAIWTSSTFVENSVMSFESIYKEPFGPPITEFLFIVGIIPLLYASEVILKASEIAEEKSAKLKSLWMGIGLLVLSISFPVLLTNALPTLHQLSIDIWSISILIVLVSYLVPSEMLK